MRTRCSLFITRRYELTSTIFSCMGSVQHNPIFRGLHSVYRSRTSNCPSCAWNGRSAFLRFAHIVPFTVALCPTSRLETTIPFIICTITNPINLHGIFPYTRTRNRELGVCCSMATFFRSRPFCARSMPLGHRYPLDRHWI